MSSDDELDLAPLGESVELLRGGDREGALRRMLSFAVTVWSGIPGLGKVTEEVIGALSGISSQGKLRRAISELEVEADHIRQQKAIASAVMSTLEDTVYGQSLSEDERVQRLRVLQDHRVGIDAALDAGKRSLHIRQRLVGGGATGVDLSAEALQGAVHVDQDVVTGLGTIGVKA